MCTGGIIALLLDTEIGLLHFLDKSRQTPSEKAVTLVPQKAREEGFRLLRHALQRLNDRRPSMPAIALGEVRRVCLRTLEASETKPEVVSILEDSCDSVAKQQLMRSCSQICESASRLAGCSFFLLLTHPFVFPLEHSTRSVASCSFWHWKTAWRE
jgi:hypothetical protein